MFHHNIQSPSVIKVLSMKHFESDEEEAEHPNGYQKQLRQRANQSLQQLSDALEQLHHDDDEEDEPIRCGGGSDGTLASTLEKDRPVWCQKKQSEAVNQLKSLLLKQGKDMPAPLSLSKDLVPVTQNPPDYIQHLEAEVRFCKEEQQELKRRIRVVVVENEKLRAELKTKHVDVSPKDNHILSNRTEELKLMHQAQIERLEAQVISHRRDLALSQKECEQLTGHLRRSEKEAAALRADAAPRVAASCLKCAQEAAFSAGAPATAHGQFVDRLAK
ncbi:serologically defined colon cancer antigen 8 homolog isoform X2 [Hippocampus comes]|uniref:serologically defined colon cancer antigen 8 homolog isoform X2 n=1 Tax=Hippocampus comes TaxID=109280 RepID=UPI00094E28E8|nr:PREDICTED: serologically defined colon cancer antigen 8 homolog isoform X2 [Hippocampus comes]